MSNNIIDYLNELLSKSEVNRNLYDDCFDYVERIIKLYEKNFEEYSEMYEENEEVPVELLLTLKKCLTFPYLKGKECANQMLIARNPRALSLYRNSLKDAILEYDDIDMESLQKIFTYKDNNGHINYSSDFAKTLLSGCYKFATQDFILILYSIKKYKDENGRLCTGYIGDIGTIEFKKGDVWVQGALKDTGIPARIYIRDASQLSIEDIESMGINVVEVAMEKSSSREKLQINLDEYDEEQIKESGFEERNGVIIHKATNENAYRIPYDISTYKKCREKIDEYLSWLDYLVDIDSLNGNPNREKIIFGRLIGILAYSIKYDCFQTNGITEASNLKGALLDGKAVCAGYAETVRNVFACLGIETEYVVGMNKEVGHAWNRIKLDGIWYNMDLCNAVDFINTGKCYNDGNRQITFLLESDDDFYFLKHFPFNSSKYLNWRSKCEQTLPVEELLTYMSGNRKKIAELPIRNGNISPIKPEDVIGDVRIGEIKEAQKMLVANSLVSGKEANFQETDGGR